MQLAHFFPRVRVERGVNTRRRVRLAMEAVAWLAGIWCLGTWALAQALQVSAVPDQRLWSPQRIRAWGIHLRFYPLQRARPENWPGLSIRWRVALAGSSNRVILFRG